MRGSCGSNNAADNSFCDECVSPLVAACPTCGSPGKEGKRFCGKWGAPLTSMAPALASTPPATASERTADDTASAAHELR
ncbi:MAG: zinc ribbon domain-containing protein [Nocardioidaceae bacterium]|nr:zinc ribbon domain-containing protein [Nocardioidaceae bacterium]